jgi:hypothetical protein
MLLVVYAQSDQLVAGASIPQMVGSIPGLVLHGHPVAADPQAQASVMSSELAHRIGVARLYKNRMNGQAVLVGQAVASLC